MAKSYRRVRHCAKRHLEDESAEKQDESAEKQDEPAEKKQRKMALIWETLARTGVTPSLAAARMAAMDVHVSPQEAEVALAYAKQRNRLRLVFPE